MPSSVWICINLSKKGWRFACNRDLVQGVHIYRPDVGDDVNYGTKCQGAAVIASGAWRQIAGAHFGADWGRCGIAQLSRYSARYCEMGEGPPLVIVPGLAGGTELVGPVAKSLAPSFRVISYQLRGEDDCFALRRPFGLEGLVDDLQEFLDWHCLEQPLVLGVSFGGVLATLLAARQPARIRRLAIQGVGAKIEPGLLQQVASLVLPRYPLPTDSPFVNQFFNLLFGGRQRPGELFDFVTQRCWQTDQSVISQRFQLVAGLDLSPIAGAIRAPTLILSAEKDMLVSDRSGRQLKEAITGARRLKLRGCGHLAFVTQPARVAELVSNFFSDEETPMNPQDQPRKPR